jgi:hypothetical protein
MRTAKLGGSLVRLDGGVKALGELRLREECFAALVGLQQRIGRLACQREPIERRPRTFYRDQVHARRTAEGGERGKGRAQLVHERVLVAHRSSLAASGAVDRKRLLQRREHVGVVDDHPAVLARKDSNGLHQRVVPQMSPSMHGSLCNSCSCRWKCAPRDRLPVEMIGRLG